MSAIEIIFTYDYAMFSSRFSWNCILYKRTAHVSSTGCEIEFVRPQDTELWRRYDVAMTSLAGANHKTLRHQNVIKFFHWYVASNDALIP